MGWSVSIWAGSQLCLSANVLIRESCWCLPGLSSASACQCLSSELNRCLPRSVSQCLLPNLSRGVTWCLSGSAQCLSLANVCLMGLIGVLSELALTCLSANVYDENPADVFLDWALRLLADVFLVSSIDVFHEVSPNVSCQICLEESLDVFLDQPSVCLMGLIGVLSELALTCLSANVCDENPADVCLDWIHLFSCQCLCWWTQSMSA